MNVSKLEQYLLEMYSEPIIDRLIAEKFRSWINNPKSDVGKEFIKIIEAAERGEFK